MKNNTEKILFELLRASLWNADINQSMFETMTDDDWRSVYMIAKKQALLGVVYDGLMKLPKQFYPSRLILINWFVTVEKISMSNERMNEALQQFSQETSILGIDFILIKGQGLANLYPNKLSRQCGDIDIVVKNRSHYDKLYEYLCDKTGTRPKFSVKHVNFEYLGMHFEIHREIMNLYNPFRRRKFENKITKLINSGKLSYYHINERKIYLLPHKVNSVYILKHAFDHLITFGIGLRQICDWTLFMSMYKDILNKEEVTSLLKLCSIYDAANMFAYISVNYLGMDKKNLPFDYIENKERGEFLYRDIMEGGNFGTHRKGYNVDKNPILRKLKTAISIFKRSLIFFRFSPNESFWYPFDQIYRVSASMIRTK